MITLTPRERPRGAGRQRGPADSDISRAEALFAKRRRSIPTTTTRPSEAEPLSTRARRRSLSGGGADQSGQPALRAGHLAEALALYEQAIALAPDYFEAHYNRANVLHDAGRFDQAGEAYDAALALDPTHADAHFYLAVTLEKLDDQPTRGRIGRSIERLAPDGAWAELAREFTEKGLTRCFGAAVLQCYGAATSVLRARASSALASP